MFVLCRLPFLLGLSLISSVAVLHAEDWKVVKSSKTVFYTVDKAKWLPVVEGQTLPDASWLRTGKRSRVTLQRGNDRITINPDTLAGVYEQGKKGDKTVVAQQFGSVLVDVEKRKAPFLSVQTPFLAAVVKGTKFTVSVNKTAAAVAVERGVVQVTDPAHGQQADVRSGQMATVEKSSASTLEVTGTGQIDPIKTVAKSNLQVPAVTNDASISIDYIESTNSSLSNGKSKGGDSDNGDSSKESTGNSSASNGNSGNGKSENSSSNNGKSESGNSSNGKSENSSSSNGKSESGNSSNGKSENSNSGNGKSESGNSGNGKSENSSSNGKSDSSSSSIKSTVSSTVSAVSNTLGGSGRGSSDDDD